MPPDARYAVLLPGASCPARRYPPDRFRAAAARLARSGLPVLVCGPDPEYALVRAVAADEPGVHALTGELDVPGLAGLLAGAAVAVANNSGGAHLADVVAQFRPRSGPSEVLGVPTACTPCRQFHCPFQLACLDVPAGEVADAALRLASVAPARAGSSAGAHPSDGLPSGPCPTSPS
jgi:ADP-heptose:LPS heptosyltransferase